MLVTLNRPELMNAMSFDVMIPFRQALEEISSDNDTRVVVVPALGAGFCSGADLVGVELAKRLLWSGLDAASLEAHMRHEGVAQLYLRNLTGNFEEMIKARKDRRTRCTWTTPGRRTRESMSRAMSCSVAKDRG